jgi:hypothetical protein
MTRRWLQRIARCAIVLLKEPQDQIPEPFFPKALIERQNKELSELLWRRGEGERQLVAAETTYAQVRGNLFTALLTQFTASPRSAPLLPDWLLVLKDQSTSKTLKRG